MRMRMRGIVAKFGLIALTAMLALTACGGGSNTTSNSTAANDSKAASSESAKAEPAKKEKWVHGVITLKGDAEFQGPMAIEKGYFEKLGVDYEIMQFESDSTMIKALIAGQIDSMATSPSTALVAISQGQDIRFVGSTIPKVSHLVFAKKEIKTLKDLEGKNIGISGAGGVPHILTQGLFFKYGLSDMKVNYINAGGSGARMKALIAGKIDMAINSVDFLPQLEKNPNLHVIGNLGKELPEYVRVAYMVTGKTAETRGDVLTKVLQAEAQGMRYSIEHRDEALALAAKINKVDVTDPGITLAYDDHVKNKYLNPNIVLDPNSIKWMYDLGVNTGSIKDNNLDVNKYIDNSFAEKALEAIGEYSW